MHGTMRTKKPGSRISLTTDLEQSLDLNNPTTYLIQSKSVKRPPSPWLLQFPSSSSKASFAPISPASCCVPKHVRRVQQVYVSCCQDCVVNWKAQAGYAWAVSAGEANLKSRCVVVEHGVGSVFESDSTGWNLEPKGLEKEENMRAGSFVHQAN